MAGVNATILANAVLEAAKRAAEARKAAVAVSQEIAATRKKALGKEGKPNG